MLAVLMLASASSFPLGLSVLLIAVAVASIGVGALIAWASAARVKQIVILAAVVVGLTVLAAARVQAFIIVDHSCYWIFWC
jgi:hypothetical protein